MREKKKVWVQVLAWSIRRMEMLFLETRKTVGVPHLRSRCAPFKVILDCKRRGHYKEAVGWQVWSPGERLGRRHLFLSHSWGRIHHITGAKKWRLLFWLQIVSEKSLLSRFSHVRLCATPRTAAYQAPPSVGFSRQEYWSGLPLPSPVTA